jgi:hemerythrin-like domain-containing protein
MASLVEELRSQHRDLVVRAEDLKGWLEAGRTEADPVGAHRALVHFGMLLRSHLHQEDALFYPRARAHPACGALVAAFEEGMTHLHTTVDAYLLGWPDAASLAANPQGFRDYTGALLRVLERRIEAEEQDLFPRLADGV